MEQKNQNMQIQPNFRVPINGCLMTIILCAVAGIMINECKRSKIRLENDKRKYQMNDTVEKITVDKIAQFKDFVRGR